MKFIKTILFTSVVLLSTHVFAQEKDNNPCAEDKKKLCTECKGGDKECVKACMKKNESNLSSACKAHKESQKAQKSQSSN